MKRRKQMSFKLPTDKEISLGFEKNIFRPEWFDCVPRTRGGCEVPHRRFPFRWIVSPHAWSWNLRDPALRLPV